MAVKELIDVARFHEDVAINATTIQDSYLDQAALYAYYAALYLKAMRQTGNHKIVLDTLEAKLDQEIRNTNAAECAAMVAADPKAKPDRLTENGIRAKMYANTAYIQAIKDHNDSKAIEAFIRNALEAFTQRRDMLISLGSTQRKEMDGELRLNARATEGTALRSHAHDILSRVQQAA